MDTFRFLDTTPSFWTRLIKVSHDDDDGYGAANAVRRPRDHRHTTGRSRRAKYSRRASRAVTDRWDCRPDRELDIPLPGSQVSSEPRWQLPVPYKPV